MERTSSGISTVFAAVAVIAATAQAAIMWQSRNNHIDLNLHQQQALACAGVISKAGPFMSNVGALADLSVAAENDADTPRVLEARVYVKRLQGELNEHLSVIELIGTDELAAQASKLALDIQNLMNNATGLKNLGDEKFRDLRTYLISSIETFRAECRDMIGVDRKP